MSEERGPVLVRTVERDDGTTVSARVRCGRCGELLGIPMVIHGADTSDPVPLYGLPGSHATYHRALAKAFTAEALVDGLKVHRDPAFSRERWRLWLRSLPEAFAWWHWICDCDLPAAHCSTLPPGADHAP